jgi:hypothetical protein
MLDRTDLELIKENNDGHKLLYVRFSDEEFVFRSLSLKEYEIVLRLYNNKFKQETGVCNLSVVYPEDYEFQNCPYGYLPTVMSEYILKISDLSDTDDIKYLYYSLKNNYNLFLNCLDLIKAFIDDYTYEEMEEWTWQQVLEMVVRAENIAKFRGFDYHLDFDLINNEPIPKDETIKNILENKGNPIIYYKDEIEAELEEERNIIKQPFIIGQNWNNKEVLDGFRKKRIENQWKVK